MLQLSRGGADFTYVFDGTWGVSSLLDPSQSQVASYRYDSFGSPVSVAGSLEQPYRFSTKWYDSGTGMSDFGLRMYSATTGRWMSRDPIGESGGINLYTYSANSPTNIIDPLGLAGVGAFPTPRDAAIAAIAANNGRSISENREYGGFIFRNSDGTYSYDVFQGGEDSVEPRGVRTESDAQIGIATPPGNMAAFWHTHGGPSGYPEDFSMEDLEFADLLEGYGIVGYVGTPSGSVLEFDGSAPRSSLPINTSNSEQCRSPRAGHEVLLLP